MDDRFLTNYSEISFLDSLINSISKCDSFCFSVSFIKKAGLVLIEKHVEAALIKGVKGKIITSTYQNFTDIASLRTFKKWADTYQNFECHLDFNSFGENGFHTKGYIFQKKNEVELCIGSTNITRFALLKNIEWNISLKSNEMFSSAENALIEFDNLWDNTLVLDNDLIKKYQMQLDYAIDRWDMDYFDPISLKVKPNTMQRKALKEIQRYRDMGVERALVVSATGSGKTYLAAFDARNFNAKRLLFVVHRDKILNDAKWTFLSVFGTDKTYGLYVGDFKEIDADFIFASNYMLSMHLNDFKKDEFDYIVIDECHHATAGTYQKIINYFKPGFLLGLTATPERMDNKDVFELFGHNVPYELRLRDAILNELVVPFHYYGIRDKLADYSYRDSRIIAREIANPNNVDFIKKHIEKYKPESGKIKAIAFCSSIAHASEMAGLFEDVGYKATSLTGDNDLGQRIKAFNDLQDDDNPLQIICVVDILNEGVDIPQVNMVLFLRPTESSIVFLQQLGRGLRKYEGKEYCTVLDFIGNNYNRSIQIAMALGSLGKSTFLEKRYLMDLIRSDFKEIGVPGVIINIDELSKEEIIDFIRNENFNTKDYLIKDYENFKIFLKSNTYPSHMDYLNYDCAPDLIRFMKSRMLGGKNYSYYSFMKKIKEPSLELFSDSQEKFIDLVSDLLPIVRTDEIIILKQIFEENRLDVNSLVGYNEHVSKESLEHALFLLKSERILNDDDTPNIDSQKKEFVDYMLDLISYSLERFKVEFGEYNGSFALYRNYYKEQIMRVLLEKKLMFMKGTKFESNGVTYLFVGLKKDKDKTERTNYKDKFLSSSVFQWESENNTTPFNSVGLKLNNTRKVHLFVRKMDSEDGITLPFTYFGTGKLSNQRLSSVSSKQIDGSYLNVPTLLFDVLLDNTVPEEYWFDFEIEEER